MAAKNTNTATTHKDNTIVFRLQNDKELHGLEYTLKDWGKSKMYDETAIKAIVSSNEHSLNEPTSIPSPFARIALAKTAFAEVAEHGKKASAVYHKIVSHCLDVAEIFFTFDKWEDRLTIVKWDKEGSLKELEKGHFQFYKTLKTYLETDAEIYNFDRMKYIYILRDIHTGDMIGATSPCTLFFSSANDINQNIDNYNKNNRDKNNIDYFRLSNNHIAFSENFPLHERSWEFQKFLYAWLGKYNYKRADGKTVSIFPDIAKYLEKQKKEIGRSESEFTNLQDVKIEEEYVNLNIEILEGKNFYQQKSNPNGEIKSDFIIQSIIYDNKIKPLVLPVKDKNRLKNYSSWQLTEFTKWEEKFEEKRPYQHEEGLDSGKRRLPEETVYPNLTISDFLTESIIQLPYKINEKGFWNGNLNKDSKQSYLLPLTETFFRFFTTEELKTKRIGSEKLSMFEMKEELNGVYVHLRIPVCKKNEYVEYRRFYFNGLNPDIKNNDGAVVESEFNFALFPNIKFEKEENAHYRFGLITPKGSKDNFSATFYNGGKKTVDVNPILRNDKKDLGIDRQTFGLNRITFDNIRIDCYNTNGIIIPTFPISEKNNTIEFTFAVDLGTTNTHIEYTTGKSASVKSFDAGMTMTDMPQVMLGNEIDDIARQPFEMDFIPEIIGKEGKRKEGKTLVTYKFPVRTALEVIEGRGTSEVFPFVQANIAIPYQKLEFQNIKSQLKWSSSLDDLQYFIHSLCFMLRNKVLLNNGKLDATKIVWLYPLSMKYSGKLRTIETTWKEAYTQYFLGDISDKEKIKSITAKNLIPITESETPYLYYKEDKRHKLDISDIVTVDIGGGTTDIMIVKDSHKKDSPKYMTSFRFAASTIFGLGNDTTPVVDKYMPEFEEVIAQNDNNFKLTNILKSIKDERNNQETTGDIASFFYSLLENEILKDKSVAKNKIDFHSKLKENSEQKLVFVLFYAAIIYHIAEIMKAIGLEEPPRHITFSGNGSRLVDVIAQTNVLEDFTKLIFEKVFGKEFPEKKLTIIYSDNPKEVSAKGGINAIEKGYEMLKLRLEPLFLLDDEIIKLVDVKLEEHENKDINKITENSIAQAKKFIQDIFDCLRTKYKGGDTETLFIDEFNTDLNALKIAKEVLKTSDKDFDTWTRRYENRNEPVAETFFFYPLIGFLHRLSNEIEKSANR